MTSRQPDHRTAGTPAAATRTTRALLERAVALAESNVAEGGGPFGAVIAVGDRVVAEAGNRVTRDLDPTAHAEVTAIRAACRERGDFRLDGAVLYSSCEPCPMCLAAALWARLDAVHFAADRHDAARGGFDDLAFYEELARPREGWSRTVVRQVLVAGAVRPFDAWLATDRRTEY